MGREVARLLIAFGSVIAVVGLTFLGMGLAYVDPRSFDITWGAALMIGGGVAAIVGVAMYRVTEEPPHPRSDR